MTFKKLQAYEYISLFIISTITITCANDLSSGINTFSNNIYKSVTKDDNLIFSPFSAHALLSMLYEGTGGETSIKFEKALSLSNAEKSAAAYKTSLDNLNSAKNVTLNIANKIYIKNSYKLKETFKSIAQASFDADVDSIDFENHDAAAAEINKWVKEKTHDKIQAILSADDINDETRAVLLNAIYFKGYWSLPFNKYGTSNDKFYISENDSISHPMMHNVAFFDYADNAELDAKILKMDYKNKMFAMYIILPNNRMGINDLEKKLSITEFKNFGTHKTDDPVIATIPKFKIESTVNLQSPLEQIGLREIFTGTANFSNVIDSEEKLEIQQVIQKAFIEVNEEGTEAAAVTGGVGAVLSGGVYVPPPIFYADHPFMFFITGNLGDEADETALFVGKVVKPSYQE